MTTRRFGWQTEVVFTVAVAMSAASAVCGEIHTAARNNDLKRVQELLAKDPKLIEAKAEDDVTPLHEAARFADRELVALLLQHGANVNARCYNRFTPLHLTDDPAIARLLIKSGANLQAQSAGGTPLDRAVDDKNIELIEVFLAAGQKLDIEALVRLGRTEDVAAILKVKPWLAKAPRDCLDIAVRGRHAELVRLLLAHGADPNRAWTGVFNVSGTITPLSLAINTGDYEIAKMLLEHGARTDVHAFVGKMATTVLIYAAAHLEPRFVKLLLDHGANVDWSDDDSDPMTPLHAAAGVGDVSKVQMLLEHEADLNAETEDGTTPVFLAAVDGHRECAEFLLTKGARLDIFTASALGKSAEVAAMLERDAKLAKAADKRTRRTALFRAVQIGDTRLMELLLDHGAEVSFRAPRQYGPRSGKAYEQQRKPTRGVTPLHVAATLEDANVARLLLDRNAEVNALDDDDQTPLHVALDSGRQKIVRLLLDRGADAERGSATLASAHEDIEVARLLLERKPSQATLDKALEAAAYWKKPDFAKLLLAHGAKANMYTATSLGLKERVAELIAADPSRVNGRSKDYYDQRPIHLAAANGHKDIVELLLAKGAEAFPKGDRSALQTAAAHGHLDIVRLLVERGANINQKDRWSGLPLFDAAAGGHAEVVQFLLDRGADPLATGDSRQTSLHMAATEGAASVCEMLIRAGVSVHSKDSYGRTPLHDAASQGSTEVAALLLKQGAEVNARDRSGGTPLAYAERKHDMHYFPDAPDCKAVAELLRKSGGTK